MINALPLPDEPKPAGLPHVAYVLLWYPLFTQPFIYREVENLRRLLPLQTYTLYGPNLRHCSGEMKTSHLAPRQFGFKALGEICASLVKGFWKNPKKVVSLFRKTCIRRWPSLEVFGENFWAFFVGLALANRFKEDGIDMVYAPWPRGAATAAWIGANLAGIPFALAARGDNLNPADPDLSDKLANSSFARANNAADKKRLEDFAKGEAKGKTVLLYNSLTLPKPTLPMRFTEKNIRLLAVGRFDVTKGFDILLEACDLLKKEGFNFRLTLAGGGGKLMGLGSLEKSLRELTTKLDLDDVVTFPGLISHDELPKILLNHDIFVAPCVIDDSGKRDGIPNTVIEALAYGLPVVSTSVNALPEVVKNGETGIAVPEKNPRALADAIKQLAADPEKAMTLGAKGARLAGELFDPVKNAQRLAEIFIKCDRADKCLKRAD